MSSQWNAARIPAQHGRTAIVTGANSGLGYVTALELARHGAHVVLAVRNTTAGQAAVERIRREVPTADLQSRWLDLADLDSVRAFAAETDTVDVLVNNAGVMMCPHGFTVQGHERQFGTNHLGHFALTGLLLEKLQRGSDPRVVTVSSVMHRRGRLDFDNLDGRRGYRRTAAYARSKLANVLFALELDRRLRATGSPVRSLLAHPGYAATNLQTSGPTGLASLLMRAGNRLFAQSATQGALPQLYAATHPEIESGRFVGPGGLLELAGPPITVRPAALGTDPELARRLWTVSEELTGVRTR